VPVSINRWLLTEPGMRYPVASWGPVKSPTDRGIPEFRNVSAVGVLRSRIQSHPDTRVSGHSPKADVKESEYFSRLP
jgi:hypothetical protein